MGVWTLFTVRASNINGSGLGVALITPSGETLRQAIRIGSLTNNEAEYEALVAGLELARGLDSKVIKIKCDSQLVVNQVYGIFDTKEERMKQYLNKVQVLHARFREWSIVNILREENVEADALANLGSSTKMKGSDSGTLVQFLHSVLDVDGYCELYRRLFQGPLARCLGDSKEDYVKREVHEGVYGNHSGANSCLLKNIREGEVIDFIWDHIVSRFGIPKEIACDNGSQFVGSKVSKFLEGLNIKRITSSPYHPSINGQVESTNKVTLQNLKKKLEDAKVKWPDEILVVLWAYWTTTKSSIGETLFLFVYGLEALIPVEVGEPTLRFSRANEEANNEVLLVKLDLLEEHRNMTYVRMVAQKQRMKRYYNRRVNLHYFKVRDLVLRRVTQRTRDINAGKMGSTWEGPYQVSAITGKGSYELKN
ncbi:uncharacterized protein [Nicotiana tomentosiformis]|uniref:uncharacterized protein n=1 Tax=Nicotiana tomentosiformis TaxID=4098 RepID=UPI00388C5CDD